MKWHPWPWWLLAGWLAVVYKLAAAVAAWSGPDFDLAWFSVVLAATSAGVEIVDAAWQRIANRRADR